MGFRRLPEKPPAHITDTFPTILVVRNSNGRYRMKPRLLQVSREPEILRYVEVRIACIEHPLTVLHRIDNISQRNIKQGLGVKDMRIIHHAVIGVEPRKPQTIRIQRVSVDIFSIGMQGPPTEPCAQPILFPEVVVNLYTILVPLRWGRVRSEEVGKTIVSWSTHIYVRLRVVGHHLERHGIYEVPRPGRGLIGGSS